MASDLQWRTGFGWEPLLVFACGMVAAVIGAGFTRWAAAASRRAAAIYACIAIGSGTAAAGGRSISAPCSPTPASCGASRRSQATPAGRSTCAVTCSALGLLLCGEEKRDGGRGDAGGARSVRGRVPRWTRRAARALRCCPAPAPNCAAMWLRGSARPLRPGARDRVGHREHPRRRRSGPLRCGGRGGRYAGDAGSAAVLAAELNVTHPLSLR